LVEDTCCSEPPYSKEDGQARDTDNSVEAAYLNDPLTGDFQKSKEQGKPYALVHNRRHGEHPHFGSMFCFQVQKRRNGGLGLAFTDHDNRLLVNWIDEHGATAWWNDEVSGWERLALGDIICIVNEADTTKEMLEEFACHKPLKLQVIKGPYKAVKCFEEGVGDALSGVSALCPGELGRTSASSNSSHVTPASVQELKLAQEEVERRRRADDEAKRAAVKELSAADLQTLLASRVQMRGNKK